MVSAFRVASRRKVGQALITSQTSARWLGQVSPCQQHLGPACGDWTPWPTPCPSLVRAKLPKDGTAGNSRTWGPQG